MPGPGTTPSRHRHSFVKHPREGLYTLVVEEVATLRDPRYALFVVRDLLTEKRRKT